MDLRLARLPTQTARLAGLISQARETTSASETVWMMLWTGTLGGWTIPCALLVARVLLVSLVRAASREPQTNLDSAHGVKVITNGKSESKQCTVTDRDIDQGPA